MGILLFFIDQNNNPKLPVSPDTKAEDKNHPERQKSNGPTVLCLLDHILGNMVIHYSRTRVIHPRQGFDDVLEIIREEKLLDQGIKLIYLLVGRADVYQPPGLVIHSMEKLLGGFSRIQPRVLTVLGGILNTPADEFSISENIKEINRRLAELAGRDHHWLYFDPNVSVSVAGQVQKRFFDKEGRLNKPGCRFMAQGLVATSKAARLLQNYYNLPTK